MLSGLRKCSILIVPLLTLSLTACVTAEPNPGDKLVGRVQSNRYAAAAPGDKLVARVQPQSDNNQAGAIIGGMVAGAVIGTVIGVAINQSGHHGRGGYNRGYDGYNPNYASRGGRRGNGGGRPSGGRGYANGGIRYGNGGGYGNASGSDVGSGGSSGPNCISSVATPNPGGPGVCPIGSGW